MPTKASQRVLMSPRLMPAGSTGKRLKRAGISKHVTYHTFRHTFGTLLNANGENAKVVQELLCHASLKVTTDVYMQAVSPQKREAQSKLVRMVMDKGRMAAKASA